MHSEADFFQHHPKSSESPKFGAITGTLLQGRKDGTTQFLTWFMRNEVNQKFSTARIEGNQFETVDLERRESATATIENPALPGAPTAFAEELLLAAVEVVLNEKASEIRWLKNRHIPDEESDIFRTLEEGRKRGHYERFLNEITDKIMPEKSVVDFGSVPSTSTANLWIRIKKETSK